MVGTKTDTPLLEIPQAISVVGRDQLSGQNAQTVVQALGYTAGVATNQSPNDTRFESLRIRGFQPVLYLDGMQLPYGASAFGQPKIDPWLLERVEVLKGPSSSLYGQVAPGGMVNMVSRLPTATPVNAVEFQVDNWGRKQGNFDIGGADAKGDVMYRVTGTLHGGGTQVDYVDDFRGAVAPSFTWKPNLDTTFTVLGGYQRDITGLAFQFFPKEGTLTPNPNGRIPLTRFAGEPGFDHFDRTQYWAGYQFEHSFNDTWTVRQNLRYTDLETNTYAVAGAGALGATAVLDDTLRKLSRGAFSFPENATAFTMDTQAEARFSTGPLSHVALFGVDYRHATSELWLGISSSSDPSSPAYVPPIDVYNPIYGAPITAPAVLQHTGQKLDQTGVYVQDQIALGHWRLTLSGRHDWVSTDSITYGATTATATQDDAAFTGRAGLNYVFDFGLSPYIAYATSFQPTLGTQAGIPFKPTTGQQSEIGVKYQPAGWNLMVTAALFDITQQNIKTTDLNNPLLSVQTGEGRSRGAEIEATATLTNGLKLIASYTYTDTEVTKTNTADQLGKHFTVTPENQASAWGDYTVQGGPLAGFGLGAGVRYVGETFGNANNTLVIPDHLLVDAAVHYDLSNLDPRLRGVQLAVNASNLLNAYYVASCTSDAACYLGAGRTVMGSVRYTW